MKSLKDCYRKNPSVVFRKIKEDTILVPLCQNAADLESVYFLNPVASFIWKQIDSNNRLEQVLSAILSEFNVSAKRARSDLLGLIVKLEKIDAITRVG